MARPTSLDDLTAKRVIDAVAEGLPRDTAARLARIAPSTLALWLKKGRDGLEPYSEFSDRVKDAEAQAERTLIGVIRTHAVDTWQAAAWLLERRMPKKYALRRPEPQGVAVTPDEAEKLIAEAALLAAK